jgi:superfamily I DNA and/or RNA helicase
MENSIKISQIIGSTLIKSQLPPLDEVNDFDYVIIDEASQATITLALLGMIKGKKWILVGDDKQLLPIFKSIKSIEKCKKFSAFSHLVEKYPNRVTWLRIHYRSNEKIINFSAKEVYNGNIKPHESCKNKKLPIEYWYKEEKYKILDPNIPVIFVHVNGNEEKIDNSKVNKEEINVVFEIIRMLKECKVDMDKVGIITPFREQAKRIRERVGNVSKEVEVSTVDAFQGREKDVIIFSVTSTESFRFVSDENRLNVALTRPKYKLIVVGNAMRIKDANNKLLIKRFLRYVDELKSVFDFNEKRFIFLDLST